MLSRPNLTHPLSDISETNANFYEKCTCNDINASIRFSKFSNELKQRCIILAHKIKSKLFKEDYVCIIINKTELAMHKK